MATNVTEKDKTLHEVIDFLQKEWDAQLITLLIIQTKKCTTFTTE